MELGKIFAIGYLHPPNPNSFLSFPAPHEGDKQDRGQENKLIAQCHLQLSCWGEKAELLFLNLDCLTVVITT